MIDKDQMMRVLIDACPSFAPQWLAFQDEWREDHDDLPLYLALADLARHLIGMLEQGDTTGLRAIFVAVERLHVEGEHYVREAATIGLLEALQNLSLHKHGTEPEQFRPYLGPQSERWWDKVYQFWNYGKLIRDE